MSIFLFLLKISPFFGVFGVRSVFHNFSVSAHHHDLIYNALKRTFVRWDHHQYMAIGGQLEGMVVNLVPNTIPFALADLMKAF